MPTYLQGPRILKGAIIGVDIFNPFASVIVFQYNPQSLTRNIQARTTGGGPKANAMRLTGAPEETISLDVEIDATDQLEKGDVQAEKLGIYPQLSALEMLLYPKSSQVIANSILAALGTIEIMPMEAPMTLFIWGAKRIVPVKISGFDITEEAHDSNLNPIRAKVKLKLRVLSYSDLSVMNPGFYAFMAHQVVKETMATMGSVNNLNAIRGGDVKVGYL